MVADSVDRLQRPRFNTNFTLPPIGVSARRNPSGPPAPWVVVFG